MLDLLSQADFTRIEFVIEFEEPYILRQEVILRLRRELKKAAQVITADEPALGARIQDMLDPGLSEDPYARKVFQKPAPPFAVKPPLAEVVELDAGDQVAIEVLFFGNRAMHVNLFCLLLNRLGTLGFWRGEGRFELVNLYGLDGTGKRIMLPLPDRPDALMPIPMINMAWVIEDILSFSSPISLEFLTPARLMKSGKPLFRADFIELFPFLLRRVTSMLNMWYGLEPIDDVKGLIALADELVIVSSDLHWRDWRTLDGDSGKQDLGGIMGSVSMAEIWSDELMAVFCIAELTNFGKNAAYGCGHFKLQSAS